MKKRRIMPLIGLLAAIPLIAMAPTTKDKVSNAASNAANSYTWKNAQIGGGGYVDNIIYNYGEKNLIYARTDMGGAYRWDTQNKEWIPLTDFVGFDDWNNLGCDSLATDPVETNRVYIAAGTYTNDWTSENGCILRSKDKGNTWDITKLPFKLGANMMGRSMGERLAIDPNSNNILYMGTRSGNGLWKSTDYGVTWNKVSSFTAVGTFKPTDMDSTYYDNTLTGVVWVTFAPESSKKGSPCKKIYVGVANKAKAGGTPENTVYFSSDGGNSWSPISNQPKNNYMPHHGVLSSKGILYITYSNSVGPYDGTKGDVWKYNTSNGEWTKISPVPSESEDNYYGYGGLAVDAKNPDTLVVTTLNSWWPDANIFRSTDGGKTWIRFWDWNGYPDRTLRYTQDISASQWLTFGKEGIPPEVSPKLGWMMGNISIDPFNSDNMMYGTGATVYAANNLTDLDSGSKVKLYVNTKGIEQTAVLSLISPPTGTAHLISGLGDVCGFVHEDLTKVPKMMMISPDFSTTTSMDYAELNPLKMVRVGNVSKGSSARIGISHDTGKNWYAVKNCWSSGESDQTEGGTVAMAADGNTILWAPGGNNNPVCYSTDTGSSWRESKGLPAKATIASDRVNPKKFYGYQSGTFYISNDGGATFKATVSSDISTNTNACVKAMPGVEGDIWMAGGNGLWHSTNSGASFTKVSGVQNADVIGFGKEAPGKSYMALYMSARVNDVRGFFRSNDGGKTWVRINDDQHQYGITNSAITGDPRIYGRVYIGTNGRGIVYGDYADDNTTKNAAIAPETVTFVKNSTEQKDIEIKVDLNGNTLSSVKNGSAVLESGTDYKNENNTLTIKKVYLEKQEVGRVDLTFEFSAGENQVLVVNISGGNVVETPSPTPETDPVTDAGLEIHMYNSNKATKTSGISSQFKVVNKGETDTDLSDIKVRYYFTADGGNNFNFWCDWSEIGSENVTGKFVKMPDTKDKADHYLEIGFKDSAGSIKANQSVILNIRFSKTDWNELDQSNDYSYSADATTYSPWKSIAGYIVNKLKWGKEL